MNIICKDRRSCMTPSTQSGRVVKSVSADVDRLFAPKSIEQLALLENQIRQKLQSNEPIDIEYWEQLLYDIGVYKAKAELKKIYKSIIDSRLHGLREEQIAEAQLVQEKLSLLDRPSAASERGSDQGAIAEAPAKGLIKILPYSRSMDPDPLLKVMVEDKGLEVIEESDFLNKIVMFS